MEAVMDYGKRTLTLTECSAEEVRLVLQVVNESEIVVLLHEIKKEMETIIMTDTEVLALLKTVDDTTTKTGVNVTAIGATAATISSEVDALLVKANAAGVSPEIIAGITALGVKSLAISNASDALVPVLQGIASKGATDPVPVPVPPPVEVPPNPAG